MKNLRNIDREMWVIIILLFIVLLLWFAKFQLEQNLYLDSLTINKTNQIIQSYSLENNTLKIEYLNDASYRNISQKAKERGFIHATSLFIP